MICRICDAQGLESLGVSAFLFPGRSYAPDFHVYENFICPGCGVVSGQPEPTDEALVEHYNSAYRVSRDALTIGCKLVDAPIDLTVAGRSMARFRNFHDIIADNSRRISGLTPGKDDLVIDFGGYQGMFLYGVSELWGCKGLVVDYNGEGIRFARDFLGLKNSQVTKDIYTDTFEGKARFTTLVHSLEHLREPARFLKHLKAEVLSENGYLYIEVPNLYGSPLCEPVHFFTYSKDSLTYLLSRSGFEVIDIQTSGFPVVPEFTAHNDEENLICLARPSDAFAPNPPYADLDNIRIRLRKSYTHHSTNTVVRQFKSAARELLKFLYYLFFAGFLERISPSLAASVARLFGRRE